MLFKSVRKTADIHLVDPCYRGVCPSMAAKAKERGGTVMLPEVKRSDQSPLVTVHSPLRVVIVAVASADDAGSCVSSCRLPVGLRLRLRIPGCSLR